MKYKMNAVAIVVLLFVVVPLALARDIFLEFKAAYFLPTNDCFKDIYTHGSALYGPELTVQFSEKNPHWYGFTSIDYFQKKGHSIGLCDPTKVSLLPIAVGVKYLSTAFFCKKTELYAGLGFQPVYVRTFNCSESVLQKQSQWNLGGIAKIGAYRRLPCNMLLDLFVGYSFVQSRCFNTCIASVAQVVPLETHVSGAIFGAGIGYNF